MLVNRYAVVNEYNLVCLIFDTIKEGYEAILNGAVRTFPGSSYTVKPITGHKGVIS